MLRKTLLTLALAGFASGAFAAFAPGMSIEQIEAEVQAQLKQPNASLAAIAQAAIAAGLDASVVTAAMVTASGNAAGSVTAMLNAGAPLDDVVAGALSAGATTEAITQGATASTANVPADAIAQSIATAQAAQQNTGGGQNGTPRERDAVSPS